MATIQDLSAELLVEIFSHYVESEGQVLFLRNVARTCRFWKQLSLTPRLWRSVKGAPWSSLKRFSRRGLLYGTQSLEITHFHQDDMQNLSDVLKNIRKLKTLRMLDTDAFDKNANLKVVQHCPELERLVMREVFLDCHRTYEMRHGLEVILTVCGPKLREIDLRLLFHMVQSKFMIAQIAENCPLLEVFRFHSAELDYSAELPIQHCCVYLGVPLLKLKSGCQRLRELDLKYCYFADDCKSNCVGFKDLKIFKLSHTGSRFLDLHSLLGDTRNLEQLVLKQNAHLVFDNIAKIPSNELKVLNIQPCIDVDRDLESVKEAAGKWKHSLLELHLEEFECNVTGVLRNFSFRNPYPKIEFLKIREDTVSLQFLKSFIRKCQHLNYLKISPKESNGAMQVFKNREEVETILCFK